jgi:hypothetical protein
MATSIKSEAVKTEEPKQVELVIHEVEENSIIVNVQGWRMRVYFDAKFNPENLRYGQNIVLSYFGDIEDPFSIKFNKLK